MVAGEKPLRVFVISKSETGYNAIKELLSFEKHLETVFAKSGGEARRIIMSEEFDVAVVNAPLGDEFGDGLSRMLCESADCETVMLVKSELFDEISYKVEDFGVLTVSKPVSKPLFHQAFRLAVAGSRRNTGLKTENRKLLSKIEEIKLVERAKWMLMEREGISEQAAHKQIEKKAMDTRRTRFEIAQEIIQSHSI